MSKQRKPALPDAVAARMAKRTFIATSIRSTDHPHDRFIRAVREGAVPDLNDMQIVAENLESVLSKKETFARAFGLVVGQGRKPDDRIKRRHNLINAEIEELRDEGWTLEKAAALVSQRYSISVDSVLKVHKGSGVTRNANWARKRHMRL
jgi:hypothetical protein